MKIKTNRELLTSMEFVSITDIILNLFVFFFVTFSLLHTFNPKKESKIQIQLPVSHGSEVKTREKIILKITKKGEFFLNKHKIKAKELEKELRLLVSLRKVTTLAVRADKGVNYGRVIETLDKAKLAGIKQLALATEKK